MNKLILHTERLLIRNLRASDLINFHAYRSNPEVTKYQGFDVFSMQQAEDFIKEQTDKEFGNPGEWVQYGMENKATGQLIGDCAIKLDGNDTRLAEIGITISPSEQKKGYAKEALLSILDYLFSLPDFHRVTETVDAANTASIQLLKSTGFRQEGHFIENIFFKGQWGSEYQFAMLKSEWLKLKEHIPLS
ncbi:MAG: GNAT family N-acetyltransferase [Chitinophagaceae bacterium]|nr:GNAT family N-acetyltransferase [Chitinophagaceae bacterium]